MDASVISAVIAGCSAILVNIISNVILSSRQTALLEYRINSLEKSLSNIRELLDRVIVLETEVRNIKELIKEDRS